MSHAAFESQAQTDAEALALKIPMLVNEDPDLQRRANLFDNRWLLKIGPVEFHVAQTAGRIVSFERGPFFMRAWSFGVAAEPQDWLAHWQPIPAPGDHDILAMSKRGALQLSGDLTPLMQNLQVMKDVLASPRAIAAQTPEVRS